VRTELSICNEIDQHCTDQGEEVVGPAGDLDGGRVGGDGRLDLAAVGEVLGAEAHRHGHRRHEQVHHVTDHPPYHQRVHMGSHGWREHNSLANSI
jgi:hypothetical protein